MVEAPQTTGIAAFSKHYANFFHSQRDRQPRIHWKFIRKKLSPARIEAVQCGQVILQFTGQFVEPINPPATSQVCILSSPKGTRLPTASRRYSRQTVCATSDLRGPGQIKSVAFAEAGEDSRCTQQSDDIVHIRGKRQDPFPGPRAIRFGSAIPPKTARNQPTPKSRRII
jgi:hypothetical protein